MTIHITTTAIAISLVVLAAISTFAAFGGDPWTKGQKPLYARLTWRGWISLPCLVLMVPLSVWKETKARSEEDAKVAQAKSDDEKSQRALQDQLKDTNAQLTANQRQLTETQNQLDSANNQNLISVFSNAPQDVLNLKYYIPLSSSAAGASSIYEALTPPAPSRCKARTVHVSLWDGTETGYALTFTNHSRAGSDNGLTSAVGPQENQKSSILLSAWSLPIGFGSAMFDSTTNGSQAIAFSRRPSARTTASVALSKLLTPLLYTPDHDEWNPPVAVWVEGGGVSACKKEIESYFQEAFRGALFGLVLNTSPKSAIFFKLKAVPFDESDQDSVVTLFVRDSQPVITTDPFLTGPLRNIPPPASPWDPR